MSVTRIHYDISDVVHRLAKAKAANKGITLKQAVEDALREWQAADQMDWARCGSLLKRRYTPDIEAMTWTRSVGKRIYEELMTESDRHCLDLIAVVQPRKAD